MNEDATGQTHKRAGKRKPPRQHNPLTLNNPARHGLSDKVKRAIEFMVGNGLPRKEAAAAAGLAEDSLYRAFRNPAVLAHFKGEIEALRTSEAARNNYTGVEVRDDKQQPGKTRIEAAKYLDGHTGGINVNVGVGLSLSPGYLVDVVGHQSRTQEILRKAGSSRSVIDVEAIEVSPEE